MSKIIFADQSSDMETPTAGTRVMWASDAGYLKLRDDGGDITNVGDVALAADNIWIGQQRSALHPVTNTSNVSTFILDSYQNFSSTPGDVTALTFTIPGASAAEGQSGFIKLTNAAAYAHTLPSSGTTVFADSNFLDTVGGEGTFLISYLCDGTNVYLTTSQNLNPS